MKLDAKLHRQILLWCEANLPSKTANFHHAKDIQIKGYSQDLIFYNTDQLVKGGFIDGGYINATSYQVKDLTWEGHQYLKELRYPLLNSFRVIRRFIEFGLTLYPSIKELIGLFGN